MLEGTKLKLVRIAFIIGFIVIFSGIIIMVVTFANSVLPLETSSEQSEQVEVVAKRIRSRGSGGSGSTYRINYTYIVSFKFSDGSAKEFKVGKNSREIYDSIHEGDAGMLTYKERENIEEKIKNEDMRFDGRRFISFKKDPNVTE